MLQCNEYVEMNKFLCSLACTWMTTIDSQFYIIDSLFLDVSLLGGCLVMEERSCSVIECLTRDRWVAGSSLTGALRRDLILCLQPVPPRKTHLDTTEKLLTGA